MTSKCSQHAPNWTLQDFVFIVKTLLKSTCLVLRLDLFFFAFLLPWAPPWTILAHLGSHLAPLRLPFGPSWGSLGPSWPLLEHILELLEAILALLGSLLASSGLSWASLEVPSFNFDTPRTVLVPLLVPLGGLWTLLEHC